MDDFKNNIACLVEYDGSNFCGFQKQEKDKNARTIQTELEKSLSKFTLEPIKIVTAGRTDTGVHALGQVINFKTNITRPKQNWIRGTNALLPQDIVILDCADVPLDFNARFSATQRTYHYYLLSAPVRPVILNKKIGWTHHALDYQKMKEACNYLIGTHDFSCFRAANCQANNPIKQMTQSDVSMIKDNLFCFKFTANSFLYHMIRNIIGALVYVGIGKISITDFINLINLKNRMKSPPTFMSDGLYLDHITYDTDVLQFKQQQRNVI